MKKTNIKNKTKKGLALSLPEVSLSNPSKGFTLVETMVAVFISAFVITSLLGIIATSLYNFRYSKNDMVASYLLQESADYIRNDRDTLILQSTDSNAGWNAFLNRYANCASPLICSIDITSLNNNINICSSGNCPNFYYKDIPNSSEYFYSYSSNGAVLTTFNRKIEMRQNTTNLDEIDVKITITWMNGSLSRSKTLQFSLLRWLS